MRLTISGNKYRQSIKQGIKPQSGIEFYASLGGARPVTKPSEAPKKFQRQCKSCWYMYPVGEEHICEKEVK